MLNSDLSFQRALTQWLAEHASEPSSVHFVDIDGHRCVVKLRRPKFADKLMYAVHYVRAWVLSCLCWLVLGERPRVNVLMQTTLGDEARKLEFLSRHGWRVPNVWRHTPDVLVLEYVGQDLPYLIRIDTPAARLIWMDLRGRQFGITERQDLSLRLLQAYLAANPDPSVKEALQRISAAMACIQKYLGWLLKCLPGRDIRGFLYVTDALRLSLPDE